MPLAGVTIATGTTNQVLVNGGTAGVAGAVTFSLPQSIATTSTPTFGGVTLTATSSITSSSYQTGLVNPSFTPPSGSASFAAWEINPTINGTSSGIAYGLVIASKTNTLTGGSIKLLSLGTTTTDAFTGYTENFVITTDGAMASNGSITTLNGVVQLNGTSTGLGVRVAPVGLAWIAAKANSIGDRMLALQDNSGNNTFTVDANGALTIADTSANKTLITGSGYSLTGSSTQAMVSLAGTLNTSGVVDVFKVAITDTAHGAGTHLVALYGGAAGATLEFSVDTAGVPNVQSGGSTTISTGVGSVKMSTANAATNAAWIPFAYAGTTYYFPAWTTNAP